MLKKCRKRLGMNNINSSFWWRGVGGIPLLLFVLCAWIGPEPKWNNPWDKEGTNPMEPPIITRVFPDSIVTIQIHDTLLISVEATSAEGSVAGYRWFFDGKDDSIFTSQGVLRSVWGINDTGIRRIMVQAVNELDMTSEPAYFRVLVYSCRPYIVARINDTIVGQKADVRKEFVAGDSCSGRIVKYFWGTEGAGWFDSTAVDNQDPVVKSFTNPGGGNLRIRWGAMDDDGLFVFDTFNILFNRGPDSVWLKGIASGDTIKWKKYDIIGNTGSIEFGFLSTDPDSFDTMTYTFVLINATNDTIVRYIGRDSVIESGKLTPNTTYFWRIGVKDLFGDSSESLGKFITAPPPPSPQGMVLILSAGKDFQMGQSGFDSSETPIHTVHFTYCFWMDTVEVTQKAFSAVMKTAFPAADSNKPVVDITWFDAALYCNARSKLDARDTVYQYESKEGEPGRKCILKDVRMRTDVTGYRLPTEAEWEYACRIDSLTLFFWGNSYAAAEEYAWTRENSGNRVHEVARKKPNRFGLYDIAGNVWEWCNDWFDAGYYSTAPHLDPTGPQQGTEKAIRGGSWKNSLFFAQAGTRSKTPPQNSSNAIGFRTVLVLKNN